MDKFFVLVRGDLVLLFDALVSLLVHGLTHLDFVLHAAPVLLELLLDANNFILLGLIHAVLHLL